jgi:hypothetical protein
MGMGCRTTRGARAALTATLLCALFAAPLAAGGRGARITRGGFSGGSRSDSDGDNDIDRGFVRAWAVCSFTILLNLSRFSH